jgi:hypothetical protein
MSQSFNSPNNPYGGPQPGAGGNMPGYAPPPSTEPLKAPGIVLMVLAVLWLLFIAVYGVIVLIAAFTSPQEGALISGLIVATLYFGIAICQVVILYGANCMRNGVNKKMSMTAAILSVIPCTGPCCLFGIGVGIWALVLMNQPNVSSAFRS